MPLPVRTPLAQLPTPQHRLDRLSDELRLDLWIKRDDLTGLALGGNKGRKLEYLMTDVLASGAKSVVSCGALQSNFVRQLAAACAMFRLNCHTVVMELPFDAAVGKPQGNALSSTNGNVLLDGLFGAHLHLVPDGDWSVLYSESEELAAKLEADGQTVYRIPVGGSSALGGYAFFEAAKELEGHLDALVTSTSSGSTQAGLALAFRDTNTRVVGIAADPEPDLIEDVLRVSNGLTELLGTATMKPEQFEVRLDWACPGYGIPSEASNAAIKLMATREGIVLDPIYSGKAFAGLIEMARNRELSGRVLFWHTGGVPAIFSV
jgi:D-cysteine desulfhydrase family pyridoxal phosphate-dependent enzyme